VSCVFGLLSTAGSAAVAVHCQAASLTQSLQLRVDIILCTVCISTAWQQSRGCMGAQFAITTRT
jgi:hypothetical protein